MTPVVRFRFIPWATMFLGWFGGGLARSDEDIGKVQVFILAGQSNMVGMGSIDHLDLLVNRNDDNSSNKNEYRAALYDDVNATYKTSVNVHVKYSMLNASGMLTVARDSGYAAPGNFGPELMFGFTIGGDHQGSKTPKYDDAGRVLLIKTAWGGKSLAVDFRPPSAGTGTYDNIKPHDYGAYYRQMIDDVLETLSDIGRYVPGAVGHDLAGFVWFHGWNDMLNYPMVYEYGGNMVNFINDVRADLDAPYLPFVVGELGMHGLNYTGHGADRVDDMRKAQRDVTLLPEFQANTLFIPTASYAVVNETTYNGIHHYYGRADTYFHIGKALGEGMAKLLYSPNSQTGCDMKPRCRNQATQ